MSNNKYDATFHGKRPEVNPGVAVHMDVFYYAVCHNCGWEGQVRLSEGIAEFEAENHRCADA